jgi:hypothetical protein
VDSALAHAQAVQLSECAGRQFASWHYSTLQHQGCVLTAGDISPKVADHAPGPILALSSDPAKRIFVSCNIHLGAKVSKMGLMLCARLPKNSSFLVWHAGGPQQPPLLPLPAFDATQQQAYLPQWSQAGPQQSFAAAQQAQQQQQLRQQQQQQPQQHTSFDNLVKTSVPSAGPGDYLE